MTIIVLLFKNALILLIIFSSSSVSTEESASSKIKILGFLITALAMAMRCFWPSEILQAFSPITVSYPWTRPFIKPCIQLTSAAISISLKPAFSSPYLILFAIVSSHRYGSWSTTPICSYNETYFMLFILFPSIVISPFKG